MQKLKLNNMKHLYTICFLIASCLFATGQSVIFSDDFDSYIHGTGLVASNPTWSYWNVSSNTDAVIDSTQSFSENNSLLVNGTTTDVILPIGPYTSGIYFIDFKMLLPQASTGGYFNLLHVWNSNSTNYEWAVDVFFDANGSCYITSGGTQNPTNFVAQVGEWFEIQVQVYLNDDIGVITANGNEIASFPWSINNGSGAAGTLQLAALNFYGTNFANTSGTYHIDDVKVTEIPPLNAVNTDETNTLMLFPNPAQNFFVVSGINAGDCKMTLGDLSGKTVLSYTLNNANNLVDVSMLKPGVYFVTLEQRNNQKVQKLVVH
jgi:hypothetical protein